MTTQDFHAHNLDVELDNIRTTLRDGYKDALNYPINDVQRFLSRLFDFLEGHTADSGFVRVSDKMAEGHDEQ